MQGASLYGAQMQGALLYGTKMQGASLVGAHMQGASLYGAQMLGLDLTGARLDNTELHRPALWRARVDRATLTEAILADPWLDRVAGAEDGILEILGVPLPWTHDNYADLKQQVEQAIPAGAAREDAAERIARLDPAVPPGPDQAANDAETDALEAFGKQRLYPRFSGAARTIDDFDWKGWAQALGDLGCTYETPPFLVAGLARNFIDYFLFRPTGIPEEAQRALAKRFRDPAGTGAAGLDPVRMRQLTEAARDPPPAAQ